MVGAGRFELPTPGPPDRCANRAALRSDVGNQALREAGGKNKRWIATGLPPERLFQQPLNRLRRSGVGAFNQIPINIERQGRRGMA